MVDGFGGDNVQMYTDVADKSADDGGDATDQVGAVMSELEMWLADASSPMEEDGALEAASEALVQVGDRTGETEHVIEYVKRCAASVAGGAVTVKGGGDTICDALLPGLHELQRDQVREEVENGGGSDIELESGVGLDEYLEEYLEAVTRLETTDHDDTETSFRFEFRDGLTIELENEFLFMADFWEIVGSKSNVNLKREMVNEVAREFVGEDPTEHEESRDLFDIISVGPPERMWLPDEWSDSMTDFIDEHTDPVTEDRQSLGPRTEAWQILCAAVRKGRASRDLHSSYDNGAVYVHDVDEDTTEYWVPTSMVDDACEDLAATRQTLALEVNARGAVSDAVSGRGARYESVRTSPSSYWWRIKADHEAVKPPASIVDEFDDGGIHTGSSAAADGGYTSFGGGDEE